MKYIPRHTRSIEIEFSSKGQLLFRATFPIKNKPNDSILNFYKVTKVAIASSQGIPVWQGGIAIDLPDDATPYDYKIILHYLEGLKMSVR